MTFALVFLAVLVQAFATKSYPGHQVLRIPFNSSTELQSVLALSDRFLADVWATSVLGGFVDVMVSPVNRLHFTKNFPQHIVHIADVEATLVASQNENKVASKVTFDFDFFPTFGQVRTWVAQQVAAHDDVASHISIGSTYEGEEINGVSLGDPSSPIFYIHCTIHAREWITTTSCLYILDQLLNKDVDRQLLLDRYHWVLIPILNIDGYDYSHTSDRLWRKNRQPNAGSSCSGTDVNRNYAYGWGGPGASTNPCSETFRGARAFSSPEANAENQFLAPFLDVGTVKVYLDIHSYGGYFLSAWGYTTSSNPSDYPAMRTQMVSATTTMRGINGNTYTFGPSGSTLYVTSGSTVDHLYGDGGVVQAYTIECTGTSFTPSIAQIKPIGAEVWAGVKKVATDQLREM